MPFWRCFYHVIWSTKRRAPLITPQNEPTLFEVVTRKSSELECPILGMNAVSDHIHIAMTIAPKVSVAHWVKTIKGATAFEINAAFPDTPERFYWQTGYGVLTFGARNLDTVLAYIARQKEHHAEGTIQPYLEEMDE